MFFGTQALGIRGCVSKTEQAASSPKQDIRVADITKQPYLVTGLMLNLLMAHLESQYIYAAEWGRRAEWK